MGEWSRGVGLETSKPSDDVSRRIGKTLELAHDVQIDSVLDFGCGDGAMIRGLNRLTVWGVEPDEKARNSCLKDGLKVVADLDGLNNLDKSFDLVTMYHVIEHLYEPSLVLASVRKVMSPSGFIIIETPNSMDALLTLYQCAAYQSFTYWSHHPMLYSLQALRHLLERNGFEIWEATTIQRYSLDNHLYWLSKGKPGGHTFWKDLFSEEAREEYSRNLCRQGLGDTLWVVAKLASR